MSIKSLSLVAAAALAMCAGAAQAANGFANGGFEDAGAGTLAAAWLPAAAGYTRTNAEAHTGSFSALLSSPLFNAAVMLQNSKKEGGLPNLVAGDTPMLSFWAKGAVGPTGNVLFALRYLDDIGNPLANSGNVFFQADINTTSWSKISYNLGAVPVGATAAFIEFSQGKGDLGPLGAVYVDDVILGVVPEPGTYALMLAGLVGVGAVARRRRAA